MSSEKANILIVDDEVDILDGLDFLLRDDYFIFKAANGKEALEYLREKPIDMVLLDIMMPEMDGYELARKMKQESLDIPLIFLTAKAQPEDRVKGLELGADDYITKPFNKEELYLRIQQKLILRNKIEIRNKRLSTIYHNIIDPINGLQGFMDIQANLVNQYKTNFLSTKIDEDKYLISKKGLENFEAQFHDSLQSMREAVSHLVKLINNYDEIYARFKVELYQASVPLTSLIYNALLVKPKQLQCNLISSIPDIDILADAGKMYSVFYELFDNAVLHNDSRVPCVDLDIRVGPSSVVFYFKDNGRGIDEKDVANIFNEFWTGYDKLHHTRGDGLGLWICQKYIKAHQGNIWVEESVLEQGTIIGFSLPIKKD